MKDVNVKRGSEGPSHDPYSFTEFSWKKDGKVVVLHQGLANWCDVDGVRHEKFGDEKEYQAYPVEVFEKETGIKVEDIYDELYGDNPIVCEKCGPEAGIEEMSGYPGETFIICSNCRNVLDTSFDESAII